MDGRMTPRIGSLFTGAGGLDAAVEAFFGAETVWRSDIKPASCALIEHYWPGTNLGDITKIDWSAVPPVDIITGGFPCTDVSQAGKRAGLIRYGDNTRTGLWGHMARAVEILRPSLVVAENVRGLLSGKADRPAPVGLGAEPVEEGELRALGAVLGDLADLGYDAAWCGLRASEVGACHQRFRVFVVAWPSARHADSDRDGALVELPSGPGPDPIGVRGIDRFAWPSASHPDGLAKATGCAFEGQCEALGNPRSVKGTVRSDGVVSQPDRLTPTSTVTVQDTANNGGPSQHLRNTPPLNAVATTLLPTPRVSDMNGAGFHGTGGLDLCTAVTLLPTPKESDGTKGGPNQRGSSGDLTILSVAARHDVNWGKYEAAVRRHEQMLGRPAPHPTEEGPKGRRLSPALTEWMMGWPEGWTNVPGLTRSQRLSLCGDGVVPQQAMAALAHLDGVRHAQVA